MMSTLFICLFLGYFVLRAVTYASGNKTLKTKRLLLSTLAFWKKMPLSKGNYQRKSSPYLRLLLAFMGPATLALGLVYAIELVLNSMQFEWAHMTILELEQARDNFLERFSFFSRLRQWDFLAVFTIILVSAMIPFAKRIDVLSKYVKLYRGFKIGYFIIVFTSFFTFFSGTSLAGKVDKTTHTFEAQINSNKEKLYRLYSSVREYIEEGLTEVLLEEIEAVGLLEDGSAQVENLEVLLDQVNQSRFEERIKEMLPQLDQKLKQLAEDLDSLNYQRQLLRVNEKLIEKYNESDFSYKISREGTSFSPSFDSYSGYSSTVSDPDIERTSSSGEIDLNIKIKHFDDAFDKNASDFKQLSEVDIDTRIARFDDLRQAAEVAEKSELQKAIEPATKRAVKVALDQALTGMLESLAEESPILKIIVNLFKEATISKWSNEVHDATANYIFKGDDPERAKKSLVSQLNETVSESESVQDLMRQYKSNATAKANEAQRYYANYSPRVNSIIDAAEAHEIELQRQAELKRQRQRQQARNHLSHLESNSRWEPKRQQFLRRARTEASNSISLDNTFSREQWKTYVKVFEDWNGYKVKNFEDWSKVKDLEEKFYEFIRDNGTAKAAWGFTLQQTDWNGAVFYYSYKKPDATATGKPMYLLKYYLDEIGKLHVFNSFYDYETDYAVGNLCPH